MFKIYRMTYGTAFLEDGYVEKDWKDLTLREKIRKTFFGAKYFKPCIQDILKGETGYE